MTLSMDDDDAEEKRIATVSRKPTATHMQWVLSLDRATHPLTHPMESCGQPHHQIGTNLERLWANFINKDADSPAPRSMPSLRADGTSSAPAQQISHHISVCAGHTTCSFLFDCSFNAHLQHHHNHHHPPVNKFQRCKS